MRQMLDGAFPFGLAEDSNASHLPSGDQVTAPS